MTEVLCEILNPFVEEADKDRKTELKSTEELCSQIKIMNENILVNGMKRGPFQKDGSLVVGSKDVKAHYPEIDIDVASDEVKKEIEQSDLDINVDTNEVALFLACSMSVKQIKEEGLTQLVHTRRFKKGTRPGLTCKAIMGGPATRMEDESWVPPARKPGRRQKMKMVGVMIKYAIRLVMENHFYSFDNAIRKQRKGGAIGSKLTERLGKMLMKRHNKRYTKLLSKLKVKNELNEGYVDDTTDALAAIDPGVMFEDGILVFKEELVAEDKKIPEDERTMKVLRDIANSIYKCVQFTIDFPTNYEDMKVPVLDLKLFLQDSQLVHEFYEKPCAAKLVIPFKSAHSRRMKMSVLVEEGLRRLRNNSQGMEWELSGSVMEKWS